MLSTLAETKNKNFGEQKQVQGKASVYGPKSGR